MHERFCQKPFCSSKNGLIIDVTHKVGTTPLLKHIFKNAHTGSKKRLFQNVITNPIDTGRFARLEFLQGILYFFHCNNYLELFS